MFEGRAADSTTTRSRCGSSKSWRCAIRSFPDSTSRTRCWTGNATASINGRSRSGRCWRRKSSMPPTAWPTTRTIPTTRWRWDWWRWTSCWRFRSAARRFAACGERYAALEPRELRRATVHELIDWQVNDLLQATAKRLEAGNIQLRRRRADRADPLVLPGPELAELKAELERFLHERVYRHADLLALRRHTQARLRACSIGTSLSRSCCRKSFEPGRKQGVERTRRRLPGRHDRPFCRTGIRAPVRRRNHRPSRRCPPLVTGRTADTIEVKYDDLTLCLPMRTAGAISAAFPNKVPACRM